MNDRFMVKRGREDLVYQVYALREGEAATLTIESAAAAHAMGLVRSFEEVSLEDTSELEELSAFEAKRIRADQRRRFPVYFDALDEDVFDDDGETG